MKILHAKVIVSVSFSGDGRLLLSSSDGQYRRWENPQAAKLVGGPGCTVRLWDVESGKELDRSTLIDPLKDNTTARAAFNPAPATQAASFISVVNEIPLKDNGQPRKVRLWDIENNKLHPQQFFSETIDDLRSFCITADGQRVIALNSLGGVWKWDLIGKKLISQWSDIVKDGVCSAIAPDGSIALVARQGQAFAEIDLVTGKERERWKEEKGNIQMQAGGNVQTLAFSPDSRKVLSGGKDGKVRLWDVKSAKQLHCFSGHERQVGAVVFSPDGRRALSGSDDHTVRLWDLEGKMELACFTGHGGAVKTVAFSPDGRRAASGSADYTVRLWRLWQLPPLKSVTLTTPAPPPLLNLSAEASVNELSQALKHENSTVREVATARLAKLGVEARPAMYALADTLTDAVSNATGVRRNAALAIAHIGSEAKPVVPAVANALQDSQPQEVRKYAAEALSKMKYPANEEAVPALLLAIENDTDPYVRSRCISAFTFMGPTVFKESGAQKVLTKVLHESRGGDITWFRYSAAFVLAQQLRDDAPDKTVDVLLEWLTDKSVVIYGGTDARVEGAGTAATEDSANVQTNLCETAPIDGRRNQEAIVGHVNLQVNTGGDARYVAVQALSWLGDKASKRPDVAEALRKAAKDKDEKLKKAAQEAMERLNIKEAEPKKEALPKKNPHNDYDDLAKGRWVPLLPSVEEFNRLIKEKAYIGPEPPKLVGDVLKFNECRLICPCPKAKDVIVRALVKRSGPKGASAQIVFRGANDEGVVAYFNGGGFSINKHRGSPEKWSWLMSCNSKPYDDYFEFAFAVVGDRLMVYANGRRILEARDEAPDHPALGRPVVKVVFGAIGACSADFKKIQVQVLDKMPAKAK